MSGFDSSFTRAIYFTMCNHNQAGICPPSDTVLKDSMRGVGTVPFAGIYPPPPSYDWSYAGKVK